MRKNRIEHIRNAAKKNIMKNRLKIYLAVPYTGMREESFIAVNRVAAILMKQGHVVCSPISQNHPIAEQEGLPTDWKFWKKYDLCFIEWCDALVLLKLDGWESSTGVTAEIKMARKLDKPTIPLEKDFVENSVHQKGKKKEFTKREQRNIRDVFFHTKLDVVKLAKLYQTTPSIVREIILEYNNLTNK